MCVAMSKLYIYIYICIEMYMYIYLDICIYFIYVKPHIAQSSRALEYTDCFSAEG